MNIDFSQVVTAESAAAERLAAAKAQARQHLIRSIETVTDAVTGTVPLAEKLSWVAKEAAARAVLRGDATDAEAAMIRGEAEVTGEDQGNLVKRILRNADDYRAFIAMLTGLRRAAEAGIDAATDPDQAMATVTSALERIEGALKSMGAAGGGKDGRAS